MEKTFFMVKPDGVRRGLVGKVLTRIENRGFRLEKMEYRHQVSSQLIDQHYHELVDKAFYPGIRDFMTSGPIVVGIISGEKVIETWRSMMGSTRPEEALPGTIRGDFGQAAAPTQTIQNIVHGSDSLENAKREIALWFDNESV
ncbi:Nucleoside diphosphate kinase [Streptococcus sp. DD10]|uniref:nucleoside-diphosphate kinase n=1 Tax=Streptococcus sp. DD10 TaxID=1777878 RepID=UPI0007988593|nr:nucleoside-diphosphate kinase [Streptococcus sp. DD10]KXT76757.1 Nucleoside diphosphate kinase [Streptococcus sp. DD10]